MKQIYRTNTPNSFFSMEETGEKRPRGIYCVTEKKNETTGNSFFHSQHICSLVQIELKVQSGDKNYYKLVYFDRLTPKTIYIDAKDLFINSSKNSYDIDEMISKGFIISEKCRSLVLEYFKLAAEQVPEVEGTGKTGWHGDQYIANGYNKSDIIYTGRSKVAFITNGSQKAQKDFYKEICKANPLVFFVLSYCYAGIISKFMLKGEANPLLAISGRSSKGKTTVEMLATAGFTHPMNYYSLNATMGAMEAEIHECSDLFACLDESKESTIKAEHKANFIYSLANGKKKVRPQRVGEEFNPSSVKQTKYSLLICGEESLLNNLAQSDGLKLRFNELVLSEDLALWESITTREDIEYIAEFLHENHGFIIPAFIEAVQPELDLIKSKYDKNLEECRMVLKSDSDILNRKAKVLAYSYTSAEYLAKILFDDEPDLINEYLFTMKETAERGLFSNREDFQESKDVYQDILAHIEDTHQQYFITDNEDVSRKEVIGTIKERNGIKTILVVSTQWHKFCELIKVPDSVFKSYCMVQGFIKTDKQGRTTSVRDGKRYYVLNIPRSYFDEDTSDSVPVFPAEEDKKDSPSFAIV